MSRKPSFFLIFGIHLLLFPSVGFAYFTPHRNFLQCLTLSSKNASSISQIIYTPINSTYSSVLDERIQNLRFLTPNAPKPLAIVTPLEVSQIQATVYCSRKHGFQLRVRSGGHDYEGVSYLSRVPFVILDMVNIRTVTVDAEDATAWVDSGATLGELYYRIAEKSKTLGFPAGVCPTIGVGGHFSGGGYGMMLRKYGLAADNIIDARLVDANGRLLDRESMGEDLFWAIRGGGGGTFGVVVSWKIKLVPVPKKVTAFTMRRTVEQNATKLIHRWQYVAAEKFPHELYMRIILTGPNKTDGSPTIMSLFQTLYLGGVDELLNVTFSIFPELGLTREECTEMSWIESTLRFAGFFGQPLEALLNRSSNTKNFFKNKSDYVKEPILESALEQLGKLFLQVDSGSAVVILNPYGGRMSEIADTTTPFPHRAGNIYKIQYITSWKNSSSEVSARQISWIRGLHKFMASYVSKCPRSAYVNYRDLDIGRNNEFGITSYRQARVWGEKYFKKNFDRLVRVKTMVDHSNFFWHEQSVPPLYWR